MNYLSVIFDLDGTLLDTLDDLATTCNSVLSKYNYPTHPVSAYRQFVGNGALKLLHRCLPNNIDKEEITEYHKLFVELYEKNWKNNCRPYPGVLEVINLLRTNGTSLAVLSNKPHNFTLQFVSEYFEPGTFDLIYGQRDGFPKKPDPQVAIAIAEKLGTPLQQTLFVGDSSVDIQTGRNAGMDTVGVSWGFRGREELIAHGATYIIDNPKELLSYVCPAK